MKKIIDFIKLTVWTAEFAWKIVTFLIVAAGGTTAGLLASGLEVFNSYGWLAWFGVALLAALITALIIYLVRASQLASAEAAVASAIAAKSSQINPLLSSFSDVVIHLADLHLPGRQVHEHKQFRRCKFVGPGAIALIGGTFVRSGFYEIGHILIIPDNTFVSGITVLMNCTVEDCEFFRTAILIPRAQAETFQKIPGVQVAI
ncbi:hypothetical protein [Derxia gummosa]|uniref:Uncharacterized protein n=1 Tax=Derxia gummosa DSM 723 TaxID=1121388 RepID=A0A8B6XCH8_9BURK|nr:hypothetical protein [Derxia gummosa]